MWRSMPVLLLIAAWTVPLFAQGGPPEDRPRWGRERVETVIIGKFANELDLTPEQAEKFFPRFRQFQNEAEGWMREQHQRRMEMDLLSQNPDADKRRVEELLTEQARHEQRISDLKRQFLGEVGSFLSPQQVSRCSILLDDLPRRVQQFIEEHRGPRTGPGQGRGRHQPR
ncbi:periplasmic heavy metal sensor [bacterium]|nr:periplasmic heavy metal sensor [bacterium]MBU1984026.1 periplasmic heavy metal sensor [bacterium]